MGRKSINEAFTVKLLCNTFMHGVYIMIFNKVPSYISQLTHVNDQLCIY